MLDVVSAYGAGGPGGCLCRGLPFGITSPVYAARASQTRLAKSVLAVLKKSTPLTIHNLS